MIYTTWQRLTDTREYKPGEDSPENHYINQTVVTTCLEMLTQLSNKEEALVDDVRALFVYGNEIKPKLSAQLQKKVKEARRSVRHQYLREWNRRPYEEELTAIFNRANKAR